jgi:hypothetical protein
MKKLLIIPILLIALTAFNQKYKPGKAGGGLYNTGMNSIDKGWFFGVGATYMMPYPPVSENIDFTTGGNEFHTRYFASPKTTFMKSFTTQFGPFLEVGLFRMNDRRVINYMDYGIGYKWFRGGENYKEETFSNGISTGEIQTRGSYSDHYLSGNFKVGNRFDQSENLFYVNGLGLNLDYGIITSRSGNPPIPGVDYKDGPASLLGELHYFFGMGFKTGKRLIIMPIAETPILALLPFNHIFSTHDYFNTRARPFIIRVRFMFLKKGSKSCPAVFNPMGIDPNGNLVK